MFGKRYFAVRYFAPRFFPPVSEAGAAYFNVIHRYYRHLL